MFVMLAGLVAVAGLPGALLFRAPVAGRARRAALPAEERAFWSVVLSCAVTTLVVLALAAFGAYTFGRLVAIDLGLSALIVVVWRGKLLYGGEAARPDWAALGPVALVAGGLALFFPPSEYIMGGKDPGVYVIEGIQIAQRGSLTIPDWTLAAVPADLRELFLTIGAGEVDEGTHEGVRFMGFFVASRERGEVVGQFPHGFPAWVAVGYGLDGLTGARRAVGFWALMGLLAVYFAGARLVGRLPAAAGTLLLALNVAEVWFSRYPNSELMQQALFFSALLALARAQVDGDGFFAPVSGTLLGLMMFTRFDAIVLLAAVGGGLALLRLNGSRLHVSFAVPLAALLGLATPYFAGPMRAYIAIPLLKAGGARGIGLAALALVLLGISAGTLRTRWPELARTVRTWLPRVLVVTMVAAACYAAFLRAPSATIYDASGVVVRQGLAEHDAYALRVYTWYVGAAGLAAAVLGFAFVTWRSFWRDPVLLAVTAAVSVFFFYKIRIVPEHFWQARRYLPVVLPVTCLLAAGGALAPLQAWRMRGRTAVLACGGAFLVLIAWQSFSVTRPILGHVEYAGLIPAVEELAGRFTDRDLLVVESRNASDVHVLATPLAYIYARNVLLFSSPRPDRVKVEQFLEWASHEYARVVFIADGGTDLANARLEAKPLDLFRFQVAEYESPRDRLPREVRQKKFSLGIYELSLAAGPVPVRDIDVGGFDDPWVLRMHAKEEGEKTTYRWTRDVSYVSLQGVDRTDRTITLRMYDGGRPPAGGPAVVEIQLNDRPIGTVTVAGGWRDYQVPIPPDVASDAAAREVPSVVRLVSATWTPSSILGGSDDRQLGVMLDRVRVE